MVLSSEFLSVWFRDVTVSDFGTIAVGAAFGTAKAGIGIAGLGTFKPELIMKVRSCFLRCVQSMLNYF